MFSRKRKFLKGSIGGWIVAILAALIIAGGAAYYFLAPRCNMPVQIGVGQVDNRFKITTSQVEQITNQAINVWNSQMGRKVFTYSAGAPLKINLIYDQRQEQLDQLTQQSSDLQKSGNSVENFKAKIEADIADYQNDLAAYNDKVEYYNSHGGAPLDEYQALQNEKVQLGQRRETIISQSKLLDLEIKNYNNNLDGLKQEIEESKNTIVTKGYYMPPPDNKINVYTYGNDAELRMVLVHEMGHALGVGHAQNPKSIMYYMLSQQVFDNPTLSTEDIELVKEKCNLR